VSDSLPFPFWIVSKRCGAVPVPVAASGAVGFIVAFATAGEAATFMEAQGKASFELTQVTRERYGDFALGLRSGGLNGICLNPGISATWFGLDDDAADVLASQPDAKDQESPTKIMKSRSAHGERRR